eukprot:11817373-Ditylum_brightwellii.AAC.1
MDGALYSTVSTGGSDAIIDDCGVGCYDVGKPVPPLQHSPFPSICADEPMVNDSSECRYDVIDFPGTPQKAVATSSVDDALSLSSCGNESTACNGDSNKHAGNNIGHRIPRKQLFTEENLVNSVNDEEVSAVDVTDIATAVELLQ